jgi:hypothetical protein
LTGWAQRDDGAPPATAVPAYLEKYADGIARIGMDPEGFAAAFGTAIRMTPERLRGH